MTWTRVLVSEPDYSAAAAALFPLSLMFTDVTVATSGVSRHPFTRP